MFYFMSVHSEVILDKIHGTPLREGSSGGDFCYNCLLLLFFWAGYYNTLTQIRHAVLTAVHDDVISRSRKGTFLQGSPALALAAPLLLHCKPSQEYNPASTSERCATHWHWCYATAVVRQTKYTCMHYTHHSGHWGRIKSRRCCRHLIAHNVQISTSNFPLATYSQGSFPSFLRFPANVFVPATPLRFGP